MILMLLLLIWTVIMLVAVLIMLWLNRRRYPRSALPTRREQLITAIEFRTRRPYTGETKRLDCEDEGLIDRLVDRTTSAEAYDEAIRRVGAQSELLTSTYIKVLKEWGVLR